jgi:P4 family phage/plasmid primase-like protien
MINAAIVRKGNLGVLLTAGLVSLDIDDDAWVDAFTLKQPFSETLRSKGRRGCNFWLRMVGDYPNGQNVYKLKSGEKVIGEWRCGPGAQTVIWGEHEKSTAENPIRYRRIVTGPAIETAFLELPWPAGITLPWQKKSEPTQGAPTGTNLDKRISAYMAQIPGAVSGHDGHGQAFNAACALINGWGLGIDQAMPYMQAYNQRCEPPWTDKELAHKLADAEKVQHEKPRGHLLGGNSYDAEHPPAGEVLDEHATETQLARVLESKLPPVRCVDEDWFVYRKGVWSKTSRSEFKPLALSIQDQRTRKVRKADEVLRHVEFASQVSGKEFRSFHFQDNDEILLNCANCVLAVSPLEVRTLPHSERYLFMQQLAAIYRPEASAPAFEQALEFALPDPADIELLRCFSGYVLMPGCRHEAALLCYGESETCKSTVSTGIEAVLGSDLVTKFSLAQISNPESKNLAKLAGSALNLSTELDAIEVGSENFKCLVSGESIDADRKFRDSISLLTGCKFWFNANHLPKFKAGTDAELRRLHFLRFGQKVQERDETLKDRIKTEADGVLIFMLDGLRSLLSRRGFPYAGTRSRQTKDRFKIQHDPISAFIETECVLGQSHRIIKIQLYDAYAKFGEANGIPPYSQTNFYRELYARYTSLKPIRDRDGDVRTQKVTGIDLRGDELKLYQNTPDHPDLNVD